MPDTQKKRTRKSVAQIVETIDPAYLSLVDSPANRTAFKVVRQDNEDGDEVVTTTETRKRTRKARFDEGLLSIRLPAEITRTEAEEMLVSYGMAEDYELVEEDNGAFSLSRRSVNQSKFETTEIDLGNGGSAIITNNALYEGKPSVTRHDEMEIGGGITLTSIEFDEAFFDESIDTTSDAAKQEVYHWLNENDIGFNDGSVEQFEGGVIVTRYATNKPVKKVSIQDGVKCAIIRSDVVDIPKKLRRSITGESFSKWGWGQIDFAAALEDANDSWSAVGILDEVLENIVLRSALPPEERQVLRDAALSQYSTYMKNLVDSMPRNILEQMNGGFSDDGNSTRTDSNLEDDIMATEAENQEVEQRSEVAASEGQSNDGMITISEEDLQKRIDAAVAAATKQEEVKEEEVTESRSDDGKADPILAALEKISGSIDELKSRQDKTDEKLEELSGETVARSDEDDEGEGEGNEGTAKRKDVFDGAFGSMGGLRRIG